ncbi:MAG TPA: riboflavin synthase [Myxococcaceae bacterium]|nr:riboflavin synthase [Myxococcaceae bacterium]
MFTGLVQDVGTVERIHSGAMTEVWIRTALGAASFELGESIAVDGACLTVVERAGETFRVQASPETLRRTTLGRLQAGSRVNLERAMRLSDRLGGHLVLGHVDAVTEILEARTEGGSLVMAFGLPEALAPFFIDKGSVALDGVSLTVNEVLPARFTVALIPETQARTTLARKAVGERVNVEADLIGKYVARLYGARAAKGAGGLSEETLRLAGFGASGQGNTGQGNKES